MTTNSTPFALRLDWARSLFDHGDFSAAATALAELVDETGTAEPLHGTTDLRLLLARAYFGSAQLGRAETALRPWSRTPLTTATSTCCSAAPSSASVGTTTPSATSRSPRCSATTRARSPTVLPPA